MSFFEEHSHHPEVELSDEQVAYYRQVLIAHRSRGRVGVCRVCKVDRCRDWVHAYDMLAAAGHVMADVLTPDTKL